MLFAPKKAFYSILGRFQRIVVLFGSDLKKYEYPGIFFVVKLLSANLKILGFPGYYCLSYGTQIGEFMWKPRHCLKIGDGFDSR